MRDRTFPLRPMQHEPISPDAVSPTGALRALERPPALVDAHFQPMFEEHPQPAWIHDQDTLRFLAVNAAAVAYYGYSRNEFLGMAVGDLQSPAESSAAGPVPGDAHRPTGGIRHRRKDGQERFAEIISRPVRFAGCRAQLVLVNDVTAQVSAEQAWRAQAQLLAQAQRIGRMGSWKIDLHSGRLHWSEETCALFGVSPAEFAGTIDAFLAFLDPEDRVAHTTQPDRDGAFENEYRIRRADGALRWIYERGTVEFDRSGRPVGRFGMVMDITERKRSELLQHRAARIMEAISSGVPLSSVLELIVLGIEEIMGHCVASVLIVESHGRNLRYGAAPHLPDFYNSAIDPFPIGPSAGSCGTAAFRAAPVHVADMLADPLWADLHDLAARLFETRGLRACWSTPVTDAGGTVVATVAVYHREARPPVPGDEEIIDHASHLVRLALKREQRERALYDSQVNVAASEALLRIAGRAGKLGGWSVSLPDRAVIWSDITARIHDEPHGCSPTLEQMLSYYAGDARQTMTAAFEACASRGAPFDVEAELRTATGRTIWVRCVGEAARNAGGRITRVQGACQDITERKEAEAILHREKSLLQLAGKISKVAGWSVSVPDGKLYWSSQIWEIVDYPRDRKPVLEEVLMYYLPESRARLSAAIEQCAREGVPFDLQLEAVTPAGRRLWARVAAEPDRNAQGVITAVHGAFSDITEQKQAELKIKRAAERLEATLASITDAFFTLDREWRFTYLNQEAERLLHRSRDELLGRIVWDEFPDAVGATFEREYRRSIRDGVTVGFDEYYSPLDTWFEVRAYPSEEGLAVYFRNISQRRRDEEQLRLLQACIARINDVVIIAEAAAGADLRIVYVNDAFEARTGYTRAEVLGRNPSLLRGPKTSAESLARIREAIRDGRPTRAEVVNQTKGGEHWWTELDLVPLTDASDRRTHWVAIERDITERRLADEQLRQSEARFRELAENIEEVFYNFDPVNGRQSYVNPAFESVWGRPVAEIYANANLYLECLHPDDQAAAAQARERHTGGQATDVTYRVVRPDGTIRWVSDRSIPIVDEGGTVVRIVGCARDVTEAKLAAERLAEQAALLDAAHEAIVVTTLEARIQYWNKGAERMYGWSATEARDRRITELLGQAAPNFAHACEQLLKTGEWNSEWKQRAKDGRELIVDTRWTLLQDPDGRPKSILSINSDMTERRKLEQQFLRAQRMESIGTLAGGIAHDLNNMLAPILLGVDLIRRLAPNPHALILLDRIEQSAKRGADLVKQVLSFARGVEGLRIVLPFQHILHEIETIISSTFAKNIVLEIQHAPDLWVVHGDPTQVHQVLLNLCVNARDAMPGGGRISLTASNREVDAQYAVMSRGIPAGRYVLLEVADSGSGIPPEIIDRIFEPFFTTKELGRGTGLGLSTVLGIVRSHGGFVNVYSEPGRGTTFRVYLPIAREQSAPPDAGKEDQESGFPRGSGELILVVDDEPAILQVTRETLEAFGYRALVAEDGAQAIAAYAAAKHDVALVLTDMMMPVMDGPALVAALRRMSPQLPIIGASGLSANAHVAKAAGAGIRHFLPKPYSADAMLKLIRRVLSGEGGSRTPFGPSRPPFPE
jgi:PAS domain S-box-containing protein